jgi:TetR/AcrR family transcriptional regulator, transcriptional repressor of aconitase
LNLMGSSAGQTKNVTNPIGTNMRRMSAVERKQAIVEATMPIFARKGYAQTTTKDLALAAGVSEPLLYKHFQSKKALYHEIQAFSCHGIDPMTKQLAGSEPSTSTLVVLVYYLMRNLALGKPVDVIDWDTWHRLKLRSLLEDRIFARLFERQFACYRSHMEACLEAAIRAGEAVISPVTPGNSVHFGYHVGAWLALAHSPPTKSIINCRASSKKLLDQSVWLILRGMGLTDQAIAMYYNPGALASSVLDGLR